MTWTSKTKNSGDTPTLKSRVPTKYETGYLVTPDGSQILVGADESLILIYQEEESFWNTSKSKTTGSTWSNKTKVPLS